MNELISAFLGLVIVSSIMIGGSYVIDYYGYSDVCIPEGGNNFTDGTCVTEAQFMVGFMWYGTAMLSPFLIGFYYIFGCDQKKRGDEE